MTAGTTRPEPNDGDRATVDHWDQVYSKGPRPRLPSPLVVGTRNVQRLLTPYVQPGMRVLEIGGAPGKYLAWLAAVRRADVATIDYSTSGIAHTRELFRALALDGDFRCEDALATTFADESFDVVYSLGVVEHFEDPRPLVRKHVQLAKPGGRVVITVPNYGGLYGHLQRRFDPENLAIHNTRIMAPTSLAALAPQELVDEVVVGRMGRVGAGLVSWRRKLPAPVGAMVDYGAKLVGLMQPFDIGPLCPLLVLSMRRRHGDTLVDATEA